MCAQNVFSVRKLKYAIKRVKNGITYVAYTILMLCQRLYINICTTALFQVI